jgi:autotransporter-associated beta strand protein
VFRKIALTFSHYRFVTSDLRSSAVDLRFSARIAALILAIAFCAFASSHSVHATTYSWTGATSTDFEIGSNWSPAGPPANSLTLDLASFSGVATANQPALTASRSILGLVFSSAGWTLSGSSFTLSLGTSGIDASGQTTGTNIISSKLNISGNQTWQVGTGGTLQIDGTVSSTGTVSFQVNSAGNLGTLVLNGANTYSRNTNLFGGSLGIGNDSALGTGTLVMGGLTGATSPTIFASGAARTIANNISLDSTTAGNPTIAGSNDLTINGTVTVIGANRTLTVNNSGLTTLGGNVFLSNSAGTGRTLTINGTGNTTITGVVANFNGAGTAGGLTKSGSGTLTLTNTNTYTGATTVSGGTLLVNGSTSASSAVTVSGSGTTLGGTGTVGGTVGLSGASMINPGPSGTNGTAASVGTLTTGALTLSTGANIFHVDAYGTSTSNWDLLVVNGAVALGGTSTLQLNIASGLSFTAGQTYILINNDTALDPIVGTFSNATQGGTVSFGGYDFTASYIGGDGNDFVLVAVPEPSTWIGGALALGALGFSQRKRFAKRLRVILLRGAYGGQVS